MKRRLAVIGIMVVAALALVGCLGPINEVLIAAFTYTQDGYEFTFDADSSIGTIDEYNWWFGDGEDGTGSAPTHTYTTTGTYTVRLIVFDTQGTSDEVTLNVTIEDVDPVDPVLVASFSYYCIETPIQTNSIVVFNGSASSPYNDIVYAEWDFGDGTTWPINNWPDEGYWVWENGERLWVTMPGSGAETCIHIFTETGTHTVTLTVWDGDGNQSSTTRKVRVR